MLIDVVGISMSANNVVDNLQVSNGEQLMTVTPYQVFDAILNGRMQSNTVVLAPLGINILNKNTGEVIQVHIPMKPEQKKMLHQILGVEEIPEKKPVSAKTKAAKEAEARLLALEKEREAFLERDKIRKEQNRAMADIAIQQGLRNLTLEERMKRRAEYFKNNRNN